MKGKILGNRYELIEKIGGGGMAIVYKAKCNLLNRYVAVKILRPEYTNDEEFVKRFRIEAQAAASLQHPNIVSIFDVGQEGDIHYIVMEYVDGITLKEYITRKGPLNWREAVRIAVQVCSAIEQAHKNHIVHRDIKPHNILITQEGIAKVTDFGIARAVSSSTITMVGSTIGSVHYFSPEQARGGFTDEKSDLYSLGIAIYEMITGKVPFDGETPVAVALKHIQDTPVPPSDLNPSIPKGLNDIVMKAIRKEQNARYPNASEMLGDLQRILREPGAEFDDNYTEEFPTRRLEAIDKVPYKTADEKSINKKGEGPTNAKKKERISMWLGILTGLVIAGIFFYIGFKIVMPLIAPDKTPQFVVGDYVGRNFYEVKDELKKSGIEAVDRTRTYSDVKGKDEILSQSIDKNQPLNAGSVIYFEVSNGPELVQVPDLKLKEARIAEQAITDLKLVPKITQENNDNVGAGLIIRTDPAVGEQLKPGSEVILVESLGPVVKQVPVPDLVGLTRVEAEKQLINNKLKIGKLLPEGVVSDVAKITSQYPKAKTMVDEGTAVDLTFAVTQETSGTSGQTVNGSYTVRESLALTNPDKYGNKIKVYIEALLAGETTGQVIYNSEVKKEDFPITIEIPVSTNGKTHVIVKFDDVIVNENDVS